MLGRPIEALASFDAALVNCGRARDYGEEIVTRIHRRELDRAELLCLFTSELKSRHHNYVCAAKGQLLYHTGDFAKALPLLSAVLDEETRAQGRKDDLGIAEMHTIISTTHRHLGNRPASLEHLLKSKAIYEFRGLEDTPQFAIILSIESELLSDVGKYAQALALRLRGLNIERKTLPTDHPQIAVTLCNIASLKVSLNCPGTQKLR